MEKSLKTSAIAALALSMAFAGLTSLPGGYEGWKAGTKLEYLQKRVNEDHASGPFHSIDFEQLWNFLHTAYLWQVQDTVSDELPPEHKKYIHAVGAVGGAHFEWAAGHNYTGLFQQADHCLLRFSSAATPMPVPDNYLLPGVAIKCLRDGVPSGNFVAMWQLDGYGMYPPKNEESCNYFDVPFSNHVANRDDLPFAIRTGAYISFARVDAAPGFVGLSDFSAFDQNGAAEDPQFPFALVFNPSKEAHNLPCEKDISMSQIKNIKPGMVLYDVYAVREPLKDSNGKPDMAKIGTLKADTTFATSKYGDEKLFFRHDFFASDQKHRPDWKGLEHDDHFKSLEGVMKYMPFLPGFESANYTQMPKKEVMLSSDSQIVV